MSLHSSLIELAKYLKQERLCVNSEKGQLYLLNEEVKASAEELCHVSWICQQQRAALNGLILGRQEVTPASCCHLTNHIDTVNFVDGYKQLSYHDSKYGDFLQALRKNPSLLANCLVLAEKSSSTMTKLCQIIFSSLYGNCLMSEDEISVLEMLKCLIELQLASSGNPRRLLQRGMCAFSTVFKLIHECLFSVKLFLTAALHKPILLLLMEDEWFYDIDPHRAMVRFPLREKERRFGKEGTEEYARKVRDYRQVTINKLVQLTEQFIIHIKNNMFCFPQSLYWIVSQVYQMVSAGGQVDGSEVRKLCADLVFAFFVCPAICDPEPYGLTSDAPVSYIARHNLMQVAQIIQVLAISTWEEIDPKLQDLYGRFEKGCMSSLLDSMLDDVVSEKPPSSQEAQIQVPCRSAVLVTNTELYTLITMLQDILSQLDDSSSIRPLIEELLNMLPPQSVESLTPVPAASGSRSHNLESEESTPNQSPSDTPQNKRKHKKKLSTVSQQEGDQLKDDDSCMDVQLEDPQPQHEDVMVITIEPNIDCPGMLSEDKVLTIENERRRRKVVTYDDLPNYDESGNEIQEKRTRFSLSNDQESIGNTSDYLEAISEGASSHSVTSDRDENLSENDNMSDMTSANVSGRGTPNISGRDTPVSGTSAAADSSGEEHQPVPDLPVTVVKTNRADVTDKFGKFDWEYRDDVKSTVSDSWSTDVLASDSEPPDRDQYERLDEVTEEIVDQFGLLRPQEVSETASESAWSTDVLASDTSERPLERLRELETDDTLSVSSKGQTPDDMDQESQDTDMQDDLLGALGGAVGGAEDIHSYSSSIGDRVELFTSSLDSSFGRSPPADQNEESRRRELREQRSPTGRFPPVNLFVSAPRRPVSDPVQAKDLKKPKPSNDTGANRMQAGPGMGAGPGPRTGPHIHVAVSDQSSFKSYKRIDKKDKKPEHLQNLKLFESLKAKGDVSNGVAVDSYEVVATSFTSETKTTRITVQHCQEEKRNREKVSISLRSTNIDSGLPDRVSELESMFPSSRTASSMNPGIAARVSGISTRSSGIDVSADEDTMTGSSLFDQQNEIINNNRLSSDLELFDPLQDSTETSEDKESLSAAIISSTVQSRDANRRTTRKTGSNGRVMSDPLTSGFDSLHLSPLTGNALSAISVSSTESAVSKSRSSTGSSTSSLLQDIGGAGVPIVKSISFDSGSIKSEDADSEKETAAKKKSGFFQNFKTRFSKGGTRKKKDEPGSPLSSSPNLAPKHFSMPVVASNEAIDEMKALSQRSQSVGSPATANNQTNPETSDDILAKYRKSSGQSLPSAEHQDSIEEETTPTKSDDHDEISRQNSKDSIEDPPYYDASNLEHCKAFLDAKRKLRLVLSVNDLRSLPVLANFSSRHFKMMSSALRDTKRENEVVAFLKLQLAEAIGLQDRDLVAQLHEVIRSLHQFDNDGIKRIIHSLKEDYRSRTTYIAYLVRCKQGLLSSQAYLERLLKRVKRDKEAVNQYLISVCMRMFLEKQQKMINYLIKGFVTFRSPDEKTDFVEKFLREICSIMEEDDIWKAASDIQLEAARLLIERFAMSHIYTHAMFPNGEMDVSRDILLHKHIKELSRTITPQHRMLCIPNHYRHECPWPSAQAEIYKINVYKTPRDKLACVLRCSTTIMNILSMSNEKSVPAADDFMPVLIFVLIKANPPSLLSTVQYVNSFYEKRMTGEEMYWWMQFSSAIEFVKTLD